MAEKIDKARVARWVKLSSELAIMLLAALGFSQHHAGVLLLALFWMGAHSTFGPVKYAMLPQHLRPHELIGGNGFTDRDGHFIAILLGQMAGGMLALHSLPLTIALLMLAAALGWASSRTIPPAPQRTGLAVAPEFMARHRRSAMPGTTHTGLWTAMLGFPGSGCSARYT